MAGDGAVEVGLANDSVMVFDEESETVAVCNEVADMEGEGGVGGDDGSEAAETSVEWTLSMNIFQMADFADVFKSVYLRAT